MQPISNTIRPNTNRYKFNYVFFFKFPVRPSAIPSDVDAEVQLFFDVEEGLVDRLSKNLKIIICFG